jgi:pimeloyl-ACP methyl ester carboxylesterase
MNPFQFDEFLWRHLKRKSGSGFSFVQTRYSKIRYYDSGGARPVLLLAPDGPCFLEHFSDFISKAEKEWRVVILDLPGFGESIPENGYDHSFESATFILKELIDHLGMSEITLSLSCANGFYGIYLAKKFPALLKRLVLTQTPSFNGMKPWLKASVPNSVKVPFLGQLLVYLKRETIPKIWFKVSLPKGSAQRDRWAGLSVKRIEENCCNCLASVVQGLGKMDQSQLLGCSVSTIMIWGRKDYSHRFTNEQSLKEILPQATITVWDDCGHFPELEHTDRYLDLIRI